MRCGRLAFGVAILAFAALAPAGAIQAQDQLPAFEVASVKHNTSATARLAINRAPARLTVVGAPLLSLILMAYNVRASLARFTVEGMPTSGRTCRADCKTKDEVLSARFDVTATDQTGQLFPIGAQQGFVVLGQAIQKRLPQATPSNRDVAIALHGHPQHARQLAAHA